MLTVGVSTFLGHLVEEYMLNVDFRCVCFSGTPCRVRCIHRVHVLLSVMYFRCNLLLPSQTYGRGVHIRAATNTRFGAEYRAKWTTRTRIWPNHESRMKPRAGSRVVRMDPLTAQGCRLRNDLYCVEWDVKLYYTIPYCAKWSTRTRIWPNRESRIMNVHDSKSTFRCTERPKSELNVAGPVVQGLGQACQHTCRQGLARQSRFDRMPVLPSPMTCESTSDVNSCP